MCVCVLCVCVRVCVCFCVWFCSSGDTPYTHCTPFLHHQMYSLALSLTHTHTHTHPLTKKCENTTVTIIISVSNGAFHNRIYERCDNIKHICMHNYVRVGTGSIWWMSKLTLLLGAEKNQIAPRAIAAGLNASHTDMYIRTCIQLSVCIY